MKTLADFKRYLATPEATLQMVAIEHRNPNTGEWVSKPPHNPNPRKVAKVQTNSIALLDPMTKSGKSWLDFGKASEWQFDSASNTAVNETKYTRLTYLLGQGV